jgi:putative endonuclease
MYYVYVLISQKDGNIYIGMSSDPGKRLQGHNAGMTKSTRCRRPFDMVYKEQHLDIKSARVREKYLKSGEGRELLKSILK